MFNNNNIENNHKFRCTCFVVHSTLWAKIEALKCSSRVNVVFCMKRHLTDGTPTEQKLRIFFLNPASFYWSVFFSTFPVVFSWKGWKRRSKTRNKILFNTSRKRMTSGTINWLHWYRRRKRPHRPGSEANATKFRSTIGGKNFNNMKKYTKNTRRIPKIMECARKLQ